MKIRTITSIGIIVIVMLVLSLCRPLPVFATPTVAISSAGEGVFLLQGVGVEDAAALDIIVVYDTATLANPASLRDSLLPEQ